jgi:hypothetical protein
MSKKIIIFKNFEEKAIFDLQKIRIQYPCKDLKAYIKCSKL